VDHVVVVVEEAPMQPAEQTDEQVNDGDQTRTGPDAQRATYIGDKLPETERLTVLGDHPVARIDKLQPNRVHLATRFDPVPDLLVADHLHPAGRAIGIIGDVDFRVAVVRVANVLGVFDDKRPGPISHFAAI